MDLQYKGNGPSPCGTTSHRAPGRLPGCGRARPLPVRSPLAQPRALRLEEDLTTVVEQPRGLVAARDPHPDRSVAGRTRARAPRHEMTDLDQRARRKLEPVTAPVALDTGASEDRPAVGPPIDGYTSPGAPGRGRCAPRGQVPDRTGARVLALVGAEQARSPSAGTTRTPRHRKPGPSASSPTTRPVEDVQHETAPDVVTVLAAPRRTAGPRPPRVLDADPLGVGKSVPPIESASTSRTISFGRTPLRET